LDMAANFCLDKIATPTDENLRFMESNVDKIVWDVATKIYQQSGFQADFTRVRDIVISRLEKMRHQVQLEAEQKAAEAKRLVELKDEIFLKLRRILAEELAVDAEQVNLDSHLADDLGLGGTTYDYDYLLNLDRDMIELVVAIEEEFEIEISDEESEKIGFGFYNLPTCTVRELLDYIYQKINDTTKTK
jgi:acyl carrier protein